MLRTRPISGLTIRNGKKDAGAFDEGGGLDWEGSGGQLNLRDVIVERNTASYGGGLFARYSGLTDAMDLNQVTVSNNVAHAAAGGLGAVLTDAAAFQLRNSRVYGNTAFEGGGLLLQDGQGPPGASFRVSRTEIFSNRASLSGGIENRSGTAANPVVLLNSEVHQNTAKANGAAIGNFGVLAASGTTLAANTATLRGGACTPTAALPRA